MLEKMAIVACALMILYFVLKILALFAVWKRAEKSADDIDRLFELTKEK